MNDKVNVSSPYEVKEIIFQRRYPGYIYRREIIDDSDFGGKGNMMMVNCYSSDTGHWIGDARMARFLCKECGLRQLQKAQPYHCVCSIGFNEEDQKWYGWSHRALFGFGIGDMIFEEEYGDEDTDFSNHGSVPIRNLDEAKIAAINFAASVS